MTEIDLTFYDTSPPEVSQAVIDKARKILADGGVEDHGDGVFWVTSPSREAYIVLVSPGGDGSIIYTCTCPSATHRGGRVRCSHAYAVRLKIGDKT